MCKCISCYGGPDSHVTCYAVVGTERVRITAENQKMLDDTGRNHENVQLQAADWR
jgi:hypothetical protein